MPTYLIADIRVINQQRYEEYRLMVRDAVLGHGGRYVVRTSTVEVIEGGWAPPRLVVIEFPTRAAADPGLHPAGAPVRLLDDGEPGQPHVPDQRQTQVLHEQPTDLGLGHVC